MIKTKADLKHYLAEDLKRIGWAMPWWKAFIFSETYRVHSYIRNLRYLEYYTNNRKWYNLPMYIYHLLQHRRMSLRNGVQVCPSRFSTDKPRCAHWEKLYHIAKRIDRTQVAWYKTYTGWRDGRC